MTFSRNTRLRSLHVSDHLCSVKRHVHVELQCNDLIVSVVKEITKKAISKGSKRIQVGFYKWIQH